MDILSTVFSGTLGKTIAAVGDTVKKFVTTDQDRMRLQNELEGLLQKRDSEVEQTIRAELDAKERVLVAELSQGDAYTKRARPTVVYFGLLVVFFNYCLVPAIQTFTGQEVSPWDLPAEFWLAWGGIVSTWVIGRSAEKRGTRNKVTGFITGTASRLLS
jgi:cytochrome c-type biogenesis protein CcmH/NrfG